MKPIQKSLIQQSNDPNSFLFDSIVFGPVLSRRLGVSLGINLLPTNRKACTFDCIYCECGHTPQTLGDAVIPTVEEFVKEIEKKFIDMRLGNQTLDTITFAGNGEPTLHPYFNKVVDKLIVLRKKYFPQARIAVLTNGTRLQKPGIINSLSLVDDAIIKLDSAIPSTVEKLNCPKERFTIEDIIAQAAKLNRQCIIQTMFVRARVGEMIIDNTSEEEVDALIKALLKIKPRLVQIYSVSRIPALSSIEKIDAEKLQEIAQKLEQAGINTIVTP